MKILHILNDGQEELSSRIIEAHASSHEVKVIDLTQENISYAAIVEEIFACGKVISW